MATLIQSKQIQGIVTASVVTGEFLVSGSLVVTGSNSILGSVTASAVSSSFIGDFTGDGSGLTGITYSQIGNTPQFVGGNNITITSSSNVITVHAQLDGTGSDAQSLSINGDQLTILGGNTITIPTGSGVSDYTQLTNVPSGIISGSSQITITESQISDLSHTDISSLNQFSASIQSEVDSLTAATSSYLTQVPLGTISGSEQLPAGLISGSSQITITESQISDLSHYTDSDVKTKLNTEGVLSGSLASKLPSGLISGSTFTDYTSSIQTELAGVRADLITQFTNNDNAIQSQVTDLQTFSSSIDSQVSSLTSATSSYLTTVPSGTISGSEQLPQGLISGSSQITITESQISDLSHYTNSDVQSYIDSIGVVSGSVVAELPSGVISGSSQLPSGLISGSSQITITESQISDLTHYSDSDVKSKLDSEGVVSGSVIREIPQGTISGSQQVIDSLPSGVVSGSSQITISSSQITDLAHTQIPSGTISGSEQLPSGLISGSTQVVDSLPSGVISGSSQITITESQISDLSHTDISSLNTFTSSIQSEVDSLTAATSSYLTSIDSGIVSSSAQVTELLPSGVISGSSQITITESQISDLSHTDISSLNTFTSSIQTQVDGLSSATSSYLTSSGSVDFSDITSLPSGLVSGSTQITDGSGLVSSSAQVIEHLPQGTVSGSRQITDGSGLVSSSAQVISHLPSGVVSGSFSSSMATAVELLSEVSGANYLESKSVDSRLDTIEGSIGMYYDLSNTVWNQKYVKSGSNQASDTAGFQTGNVPFVFTLNTDRKLHYQVGDIVYINNFDRDTTIVAYVSSSYATGSREVGFNVVSVNQQTGSYRINDSYWIISRHTAGFVDSASYTEASASFDHRIDVIVASGSGADWNVNLTNIPTGLVSASNQVEDLGFPTTSSLNEVSSSLATTISNVFASSSNFDAKQLVSGSSQIDLRNVTNYVSDEHIDHTTVNINAGDGLDGGGDISSTREIRLNVTSSHFTSGVGDVLTSQGVVKQSTLDSDIVGTDFSQSVDNRINSISAGSAPQGTVSGSTQIDITQTQNYTSFSSSLSASIYDAAQSGSGQSSIDTGSFATTGSNTFVGDQNISGSLIPPPSGSGTYDLGSTTNPWTDLYVSTGSVRFVKDNRVISSVSGEENAIRVGNILITTSSIEVVNNVGQTVRELVQSKKVNDSNVDAEVVLPEGLISGSQQITDLGFFSGSIVGSGSVSVSSGSGVITISSIGGSGASTWGELSGIPSGLVSSSEQLASDISSSFTAASQSIAADIASLGGGTFDGNRVISNENLGDLFSNSVNPGTSGSLVDFINAVFYPNTGPSISTGNQTIEEYRANGASIVTLSGTDPEGQPITFGTASSYTDDLVRVASNGAMTLNALAESSSFNTDSVSGGHGHLVTVTATDSFGTVTEKDIYIIVTPNEAPVFRETSTSGNIITSVTANLNENSTNNTLVKRVYFTDSEGDSITIYSSSIDNNHFDITKYSTYVDIRQNTSSLDYEQQTQYTFSISASDEHYESGDDSDSITSMLITVNVTDNVTPTVNNQTLSSINENSSNGATVGSISAADNEGDTITFKNFELHQLQLDGSTVSSGSYGGSSQLTDPTENPFQMNSSGVVTRKTGVYLNSDLINKYIYRVQVTDSYNGDSNVGLVTINITDDTPATISDNWSSGPFIKESEVSGTTIKTTNYGSTTADYNSNQSGTWSSSNPAISINSSGNLSLGVDLSGSVTQSGDTLDSTITFTNTFGTTTTDNVSVTIVSNASPSATFSNQSSNFNTNLATNGTNLVSVSVTDDELDSPYRLTLGGTNASSFNAVPQNAASSSWQIQANGNLSAGTYNYDVTVTDSYGSVAIYSGRSLTIAQAGSGTLSPSAAYVIESATNGDQIKRSSNGLTGNQSYVSVAYSPNYGSQSATSFASSNNLVSINPSTGFLSVGNDISGSGNVAGNTITTTISWQDQYGNVGSDDIDITVTKNNAPTVSSTQTFNTNTNQATGSSEIVRLNLTDTEGDSIAVSGLSWTNYNSTYFTPSNSIGVMKLLANSTSIPAGTYPYTASIEDVHGFDTTVHSGSVTISQASTGTLGGDTSIYIIESAQSGDVFRDATGYNQGNAAQLSVSYSPNYGSQTVTQYISSTNPAISVDSSGNLTLGVDISGSVTQSGDTLSSTITFVDQYGNVGSGSVTATVFGNSAPSANFTAASFNTDEAISGSNIGTVTVTDTENNSPFTITLAGTDGGKFDVSGSSSPFTIQPTGSLEAGSYSINIAVTDTYGESVTLTNESITVEAAEVLTTVYIYRSGYGSDAGFGANYNAVMGAATLNTDVPPQVTSYTANTASPYYKFKSGDIGSSTITLAGGATATLAATVSGSSLNAAVSESADGISWASAQQTIILIPSGSSMSGVPTSMTDATGGSTTGEYVLVEYADGTSAPLGATPSVIQSIVLDSSKDGYIEWFVIGAKQQNNASTMRLKVLSSSGSISDF